ncbi:MAG: hypothetical protein ACE5FU_12985 [Nitrospinota bacterium]
MRADTLLFGEAQSRVLVSVKEKDCGLLQSLCEQESSSCTFLGKTTKERLRIKVDSQDAIEVESRVLQERWRRALPEYMEKT